MICKKCRGRVFLDMVFSEHGHVELFCIRCGKRWMIDKLAGVFGIWLDSQAKATA